ncbi:MAPEG family protein [Paraperlucidibaca baekdonensis]|uniref:MAPEG family protein n=1 Tax=Paraperlucidibaca baekdonensis TaxID=748120 RepID=A0A3E0H616_9GAMM|nr:MAPEG family protein [Paraperlucidibaca baekdonensis]REH38962.1 MAPEG family protein [Paraperlucidibaca baekdonensis]
MTPLIAPLSPAICALLCFTALTVALAFIFVGYRVALVLSFKVAANAWTRGAATHVDPPFITRVQHAQMNCVENLPVFAAIVFVASAMGQLAILEPLAMIFLGLRVAQSAVHVINTSAAMVFLRANLWLGQMAIIAYWLFELYAAH